MTTLPRFLCDEMPGQLCRYLLDNTLLVAANAEVMARAPELRPDEPLYHCPKCGRVYWRGSHYKRMHARLAAWQSAQREN